MRKKRTGTLTRLIGVIIIALALMSIFTSGSPLLTQALIKLEISQFFAGASSLARQHHLGDVNIEYSDIVLEGLAFDRRAIILNPEIKLEQQMMVSTRTLSVTTERVIVTIDKAQPNKYYVDFPEPLRLTAADGTKATITFAGTPHYILEEKKQGADIIYSNAWVLPEGFTYKPDAGEPLQVSFSPHPDMRFQYSPVTGAAEVILRTDSVFIAEPDNSGIMIGALSLRLTGGAHGGNSRPFTSELSLIDLGTRKPGAKGSGFYNFKLALEGKKTFPAVQTGSNVSTEVTLKEALLEKDNFALSAAGAFSLYPDDTLPSGQVNVSLSHFGNIRDVPSSIPDEIRPVVMEWLARITGQDPALIDNTTFTVSREPHGAAHIGAVTLDETVPATSAP